MPEGCEGFDFGYDRDTALTMSVALEFGKLVDWTTGECRFNSEDFINILNYAAHFDKIDDDIEISPKTPPPCALPRTADACHSYNDVR